MAFVVTGSCLTMGLSPEVSKAIVLVTLLVATFCFSMIPVKFARVAQQQFDPARRRRYKTVMSLLSCYAAGVFLATCLLDLFPQVRSNLQDAFASAGIKTQFPMAEFILACGLFLILITEQVVLSMKDHQRGNGYHPLPANAGSDPYFRPPNGATDELNAARQQSVMSDDTDYDENLSTYESEIAQEEAQDKAEYQDPSSHSLIRSLILLLALSLHSLFEGLAVGLQPTSKGVFSIFAALALHKSILAFSLGLNLCQSKLSLKSIIKSNFLFSVTSPIGIAFGILIIHFSPSQQTANFVDGVLEGMACGTFIFVVFFEILPHEFMTKRKYPHRMLKVFFLILGFSTVTALLFLEPDISDDGDTHTPNATSAGPKITFW